MGDEWRRNALAGGHCEARSTAQLSSSKQCIEMDVKKRSASPGEHPELFDDTKFSLFKKFYRQLFINKMLMDDETNCFQCEDNLKSLAKLEAACQQCQYHFDNDLFVAILNQFTLNKDSISTTLNKGDGGKVDCDAKSLETLDLNSLFEKSNCDTKLILQTMLDNIDNEAIFGECFERLISNANHEQRPVKCSIDDNIEVINERASEKRSPKDRRRKGKESKAKTTNNTPVLPFSESSVGSILSTNNSDCDDSKECNKPANKLAMCSEKIDVKCTSDGMNDYYNLNMPIYDSDA